MIADILQVYEQASPSDFAARHWYRHARQACQQLADETGLSLEVAVGVVAVLSPRLKWEANIREARKVIEGKTSMALGRNVEKARRILATGRVELSGPKVTSFYRNILEPDDSQAITVDTWAARVWSGDWTWGKPVDKKTYWQIAADYREAARQVGLLPCELQAITWESVRRIVTSKGGKGQLSLTI